MLLNSPEGIRYSQALASKLNSEHKTLDFDQAATTLPLVESLFRTALNRPPTAEESQLSVEFLNRHALKHQESGDRAGLLALTDLCRAILNLNEFAYID